MLDDVASALFVYSSPPLTPVPFTPVLLPPPADPLPVTFSDPPPAVNTINTSLFFSTRVPGAQYTASVSKSGSVLEPASRKMSGKQKPSW